MEKDFNCMYLKFQLVAIAGALLCMCLGALKPLEWYDYVCYAYMVFFFGFFRLNIDNVNEKRFFGIANWIALLTVEAALLLGIDMWYHPLLASLTVSLYFLLRSYIYAKQLDVGAMLKSAFWMTALNYLLFLVIKVGGVWLFSR